MREGRPEEPHVSILWRSRGRRKKGQVFAGVPGQGAREKSNVGILHLDENDQMAFNLGIPREIDGYWARVPSCEQTCGTIILWTGYSHHLEGLAVVGFHRMLTPATCGRHFGV